MIRKIFVLVISILLYAGCRPGIDQKKFANVHHAAKAVEAATSVGVNHQDFTNLLQNFATEVSVLKDQIKSEREKPVFNAYARVLETYRDSNTVWENEIADDPYPVKIISELEPIVKRYNLPTKRYEGVMGDYYEGLGSSRQSIRTIWEGASHEIEQANKLRMGETK